MSIWKTYTLGELYDFSSGLSKAREFFGYGHGFVSFKDVFYNYFLPDQLTELVDSNEKERNTCSIQRGDVFLTRTSETMEELGMSSVALRNYDNATFNGFTKRLRPKQDNIVAPEFAGYYFRSPKFRSTISQYAIMTTRASLNNEILERLTIDLPPYETQLEIGEILKSIDDKIELNNQINKNLEALAQTLFKQWFIDFEFPNENGQPYKSTGGEMAESELGMIPKDWRSGAINDMADVKGGKRLPNGSELSIAKTNHPYIRVRDFIDSKVDIANLQYVPEEIWQSIKNYTISSSDVYITIVGTIGLVGLIPSVLDGANLTENAAKIISKPDAYFSKFYLSLYLNTKAGQDEIAARTVGSTQPKLAIFRIREIPVPIPSNRILIDFDNLSNGLYSVVFSNETENVSLKKLRDTLLPKLISGELTVSREIIENTF